MVAILVRMMRQFPYVDTRNSKNWIRKCANNEGQLDAILNLLFLNSETYRKKIKISRKQEPGIENMKHF